MAAGDFFSLEARKRVGQAVEAIERGTSAEIVVTVRKRAGHYRQTDLYAGAAAALLTLVYLLESPEEFDISFMPVGVLFAFLVAALFVANTPTLRRMLTSPRVLRESATAAAHSAFYDLGISRTKGRTGILVFVSMFERRVELVPDIAVDPAAIGSEWQAIQKELQASLEGTPDFDHFLAALATMTAPLARVLPVQADDVNELPNEPVMA